MNINKILYSFSFFAISIIFTGCLSDEESIASKYSDWRAQNIEYIGAKETETIDGKLRYEKIIPDWDKNVYTLMEWHNERSSDPSDLYPLSNSTLDVKYTLTNISGDTIDQSSHYRCMPNNNITGFWIALTNMLPGDTVTAIIPYEAAYGVTGSNSILPYSTLIFNIRLDSIISYEKLPYR